MRQTPDGRRRVEKTQSASIPISDRFAGVDDPRMERAGKRELGDVTSGADIWGERSSPDAGRAVWGGLERGQDARRRTWRRSTVWR